MQYVFVNARPSSIEALRASNDLQSPIRSVTMIFDYMFVTSKKLNVVDSAGNKIMGLMAGSIPWTVWKQPLPPGPRSLRT